MQTLTIGNATLTATSKDGTVEVRWEGRSDELAADRILRGYFTACVERARGDNAMLELRMEHLEHANSASIAALVQLVTLCHAHAVRLRLAFTRRFKWQLLCTHAMKWATMSSGTTFVEV